MCTAVANAADADTQRARALFDEAGELERHGQWSAAQDRLRSALRLRDTPQLHYALGWALENDDKLLEAKGEYELTARLGREKPGAEEATRLASARLIDLERKTPVIHVRVTGGAKTTAHVIVDGREIRREDDVATTAVNPGSHVIRVERGSGNMTEEIVYVGRGAERTLDAEAGEPVAERDTARDRHASAAMSSAPRPAAARQRGDGVFPWLLFTGGLVFVGGGASLLVSASADADVQDTMFGRWCTATACTGSTATRPETPEAAGYRRNAAEAGDAESTKEAVGLVLGGLGLVGATVGAILLLRGEHRPEKPVARLTHASASPIAGGALATATLAF